MRQPANRGQNFSSSEKTTILIVAILGGVAVIALVIVLVLLLRQTAQPPAQALPTFLPTSIAPTIFVPTADCGTSSLVLGSTTFQIQTIDPAPDASFTVPADTSGVAYWVEGTDVNHVFLLSPTPDNLSLQSSLKSGDGMTVFWEDCRFEEFTISAIESGQSNDASLLDQSAPGITILVQTGPSASSFAIRSIQEQGTNTSSQSEISAELSLLDTTISADGTTISVGVSILNFGAAPFTISVSDVSLNPENAEPLGVTSVKPPLPQEIGPGVTETIYFTFPHSFSSKAVLKVLGIEFDLP